MNLIDKFRSLVITDEQSDTAVAHLKFTKKKKTITQHLISRYETNNLLAVYCSAFGEGLFLTAVENFHSEQEVHFYMYDASGLALLRNTVSIDEIRIVCSFADQYINPMLKRGVVNQIR